MNLTDEIKEITFFSYSILSLYWSL